MKIGLLSTLNHPMLPHYLLALHKEGFSEIRIICDLKALSEKDLSIINERTLGRFKTIENEDAFIHSASMNRPAFYFVKNHNAQECIKLIKHLQLDCLVNAGTPRKLGHELLASTAVGVINIHPGRLPKYRGCSSVEWSIYNCDEIANSVHLMNKEYDAGPILTVETYDKSLFSCYEDLRCHLYQSACELLPKALKGLNSGKLSFVNQNEGDAMSWKPMSKDNLAAIKASFPLMKSSMECN